MNFLQQIFYGQKVKVKTTISRIGNSAFYVHQELWQNLNKCAEGITMVHFDFQTSKLKPIYADIVEALQKHFKEV